MQDVATDGGGFASGGEDAQVLQQDAHAQADQRDPAQQFGSLAEAGAHRLADQHADGGQDEGGAADGGGDQPDVGADEGQAHAHGRGVDAGADSGGDQGPGSGTTRAGVFVRVAGLGGFPDHLAADDGEQAEGDPVVDLLHQSGCNYAEAPADQGCDGLDNAKYETRLDRADQTGTMRGAPPHGGREGVGRHAEGKNGDGPWGHDEIHRSSTQRIPCLPVRQWNALVSLGGYPLAGPRAWARVC